MQEQQGSEENRLLVEALEEFRDVGMPTLCKSKPWGLK